MISQDVYYFYKAHSVYRNYGGIAFGSDEGINIARAIGNNKAAILVNHGLITIGETVDEAAYLYMLLEKSCQVQLMVEATGLPKVIVPDDEAMDTFQMASRPVSHITSQTGNSPNILSGNTVCRVPTQLQA
jgi:ribulose-5-phosphate 4-epimerase/fuculose-1-phosphate aldolase